MKIGPPSLNHKFSPNKTEMEIEIVDLCGILNISRDEDFIFILELVNN